MLSNDQRLEPSPQANDGDELNAAFGAGAGPPIAPLFGYMDEAAFWADLAEPAELEAYCLASFRAMSRERQAEFLDYVQGRSAA